MAHRFEAIELSAWENDSSFHQLLLSLESVLPLRRPSEFRDPKVHQRILTLTEGVLVRICRPVESAAADAIRNGQEHINLTMLHAELVSESLVSIADRRSRRASDPHSRTLPIAVRPTTSKGGTALVVDATRGS